MTTYKNNLQKKASERDFFYICGIPFKFLSFRGNSANCRVGNSKQLVFIPKKYFTNDGMLKEGSDLIWFINKPDTFHKIRLAAEEEGLLRK